MLSIQPSFAKGELSPELHGRVDTAAYRVGLAQASNAVVHSYGGVSKRPGTRFIARARETDQPPRLIPFQFNINDTYVIELSADYFRFLRNDEWVNDPTSFPVFDIVIGDPTVVILNASFTGAVGEYVYISGVGGTTVLNDNWYKITAISPDTTSLTLEVNTTGEPAYTSGGTVVRHYTVDSPFSYADIFDLRFVQSADIIYFTHPNYPPYELRRMANDDWDIRPVDFSPVTADSLFPVVTVGTSGSVVDRYRITTVDTEGVESLPVIQAFETVNNIVSRSTSTPVVFTTSGTNTLANGDEIELRDFTNQPINNRRFIVQDRTATTFSLYTTDLEPVPSSEVLAVTITNVVQSGTRVNASPDITGLTDTSAFSVGDPVSGTGIPANTVINEVLSSTSIRLGSPDGQTVNATSSGTNDVTVLVNSKAVYKTFIEVTNSATTRNNTLSWTLASGANRYSIYRRSNGIYGLIGESATNEFLDSNIAPTVSISPPNYREPFISSDDYPVANGFFQQRRVLGGSRNAPDTSDFSRLGSYNDFSKSFPIQDDDAISATLSANTVSQIFHYVSQRDLLVFTNSNEWVISSDFRSGLTPSTLVQRLQSNWGSSALAPLIVDTRVLFNTPDKAGVRDIGYSFEVEGYRGTDLTIFSSHLFNGKTIRSWDYSVNPEGRVYIVRSDGEGLCLSIELDQQVNAWTTFSTDGDFEEVCVIRGIDADKVYWVVKRTIDGTDHRYIELMEDIYVENLEDFFLIDCGITAPAVETDTVVGLDHLEGETVVVLADGVVINDLVVSGGSITLPANATTIHVGLPYTTDIKTLRIEAAPQTVQGQTKRIPKVTVRFYRSKGLLIGPDASFLTPLKDDEFSDGSDLLSGDREIILNSTWDIKGQFLMRQVDPLPFTILAVVPSWEVEDGV